MNCLAKTINDDDIIRKFNQTKNVSFKIITVYMQIITCFKNKIVKNIVKFWLIKLIN